MVDSCREVENIIVELMVLEVKFEFEFVLIDYLVEFINFNWFEVVINKVNIDYFIRVGWLM